MGLGHLVSKERVDSKTKKEAGKGEYDETLLSLNNGKTISQEE